MRCSTPTRLPKNCGCCFIVPLNVLRTYAGDLRLDAQIRMKLKETFQETGRLKTFREAGRVAAVAFRRSVAPALAAAVAVQQQVFDCQNRQSLPGRLVSDPAKADEAAKMVFNVTGKVAEFYQQFFGRNSVDNQGLELVSSVHYRQDFDNAFWNGQQMVYGDGDGRLFSEFYHSPDVIGHELTHGVTQNESGLRYEGESGALNESISDVFGAAFNQWLNAWPASKPEGWLIGAGIVAKPEQDTGKTCLRDMLQPTAAHCISQQPDSYDNFDPTADVHYNSSIPNRAFAMFAQGVGGNSWDRAIQVWYTACTDKRLSANATFVDFARLTVEAAKALAGPLQEAWAKVKLPL
jgi:Zn-dependent metalloprotease